MLITARRRLLLPTGASCWRHKANRQRHKKRSKNFVASIGDLFLASCGDRVLGPRTRRISPRASSLSYWSAEVWAPSARKKDDFVLICLGRLNIFWPTSSVVRWRSSEGRGSGSS